VDLGFLGADETLAHHGAHHRVVRGEGGDAPFVQAVGAAVTDVGHPARTVRRQQQAHHGGPHAAQLRVFPCRFEDTLVCSEECLLEAGGKLAGRALEGLADGFDGEAARGRTAPVAPHAVGDDQQAVAGAVTELATVIFVARPYPAHVGEGRGGSGRRGDIEASGSRPSRDSHLLLDPSKSFRSESKWDHRIRGGIIL